LLNYFGSLLPVWVELFVHFHNEGIFILEQFTVKAQEPLLSRAQMAASMEAAIFIASVTRCFWQVGCDKPFIMRIYSVDAKKLLV